MSFNKCILTQKRLIGSEFVQIKFYLKRDSLIMDNWSSSFFNLLNKKIDKYQSIRESGFLDPFLLFASNILINLINNPTKFDILLASNILNIDFDHDPEFYIEKLVDYISYHGH